MIEAQLHLEFLLEGESDEIVLEALLPKILPAKTTYALHVFQGKQNLLKKLPERLRGYRSWLPPHWRLVILRDSDREDCKKLKEHIKDIVARESFSIFSNTEVTKEGIVIIRLAMQEMEAWFLGDAEALRQAYPRLPETLDQRQGYRQPDAIPSPWLKLEKTLKAAGYQPGGKIEVARKIAPFLAPSRNRSRSFQLFWQTLVRVSQY
jgi:hypothetical protein